MRQTSYLCLEILSNNETIYYNNPVGMLYLHEYVHVYVSA
jgi:hypothetical protein